MTTLHAPDYDKYVRVPAADSDYRCALAWVNDLRRRGGYGPLMAIRPGEPGSPAACPIAASLIDVFPQVFVSAASLDLVTCTADQQLISRVHHPHSVARFINRVDSGRFPTLIS